MKKTDRQLATEALLEAFLVARIAEGQLVIDEYIDVLTNADSSSEDEDSSSEDEDHSKDDEEGEDDINTLGLGDGSLPPLSQMFLDAALTLHSTRYLQDSVKVPKTRTQLDLLLHEYKLNHPVIFRSFVCVTPATFDALVLKIQDDPVFHNNSPNPQIPVDNQLAVTLFRFSHFGNAASTQKVGLWAGVGYGTGSMMTALQWPDDEARECAKVWVEEQSCPMWRDGWLMVDGMSVPLYARPGFFGNSFFDRESNYSMNVQTHIPQEHESLLSLAEWVWADTAYPLQTWCQAPFKKYYRRLISFRPEKDTPENTRHNYYVSKIHICLEHCVGYLKGRWSSLCGLHLQINKPKDVHFASLWITCCIMLHNLAIQVEAGMDLEADEFYQKGVALSELTQGDDNETKRQQEVAHDVALLEARLTREQLKKGLFAYLGL
ncbi:hypothetical protein K439DRAFT_1654083 [Ramaria rubella]|nr:hypothetical protein K439DRAFT_1654083 [Ramaria rubella]